MRKVLRAAAIALFVWCMMPGMADAYRYVPGYPKWKATNMPLKFYVTYADSYNWGGRTREQVKTMITGAFDMWQSATCHMVIFQFAGFTLEQAGTEDGKNIITWVGGLPGVT